MAEIGILQVGRQTDFQVHPIGLYLGACMHCIHGQDPAVILPERRGREIHASLHRQPSERRLPKMD